MDNILAELPYLLTLRPLLYGALMWGICLYAIRRGGWEERVAVAAIVVASYLTFLLVGLFRIRYAQVELPLLLVDVSLFVLLQGIALRSRKFWPLWVSAFIGVALLAHLAPLMPGILRQTYYDAIALWSYPQLIVLGFGIANHHRAVMRANRPPDLPNAR